MIHDINGVPMETIDTPTLKILEFCNSDSINGKHPDGQDKGLILVDGIVHEWIGIGWVECKPAGHDLKNITKLVNP